MYNIIEPNRRVWRDWERRWSRELSDISERTFCLQCEGESNKVQVMKRRELQRILLRACEDEQRWEWGWRDENTIEKKVGSNINRICRMIEIWGKKLGEEKWRIPWSLVLETKEEGKPIYDIGNTRWEHKWRRNLVFKMPVGLPKLSCPEVSWKYCSVDKMLKSLVYR